jgi:hypothetical protein
LQFVAVAAGVLGFAVGSQFLLEAKNMYIKKRKEEGKKKGKKKRKKKERKIWILGV